VANPAPLLGVAEQPQQPRVAVTPLRVEEQPIADRTRASNAAEAIKDIVEKYFL
jgi:hypothetical protein